MLPVTADLISLVPDVKIYLEINDNIMPVDIDLNYTDYSSDKRGLIHLSNLQCS